jgi:hypothetical protein
MNDFFELTEVDSYTEHDGKQQEYGVVDCLRVLMLYKCHKNVRI